MEDFFLFVFYFNEGLYYFLNVGLIFFDRYGCVSVYKFFDNDLLLFIKFFEFWWRCSDMIIDKDIYGCFNIWLDFIFLRDREFFIKYVVFKDKFYSKGVILYKDNFDSKLYFFGKEELFFEEIIILK